VEAIRANVAGTNPCRAVFPPIQRIHEALEKRKKKKWPPCGGLGLQPVLGGALVYTFAGVMIGASPFIGRCMALLISRKFFAVALSFETAAIAMSR
jgi:hypothetical protein